MKINTDIIKINFDSIPVAPFWNISDEADKVIFKDMGMISE